jgi:hypothetical protein
MILKQLSFRPETRSATALEAGEQMAAALEGQLREGWSRRRAISLLAGAGAAGVAGFVWSRASRPFDPADRVIEVAMGTELVEHGFTRDHDIDYRVQYNSDGSALDSIRLMSPDQGYYWRPFTKAQAREAQLKGWKLTMEGAVEAGNLWALVDNPRASCRYMAVLTRNPDQTDNAACLVHVAPVRQGIERVLPGPGGARHQLVLAWTPATQGELWVDGTKLITGYAGEPNFRYGHGLEFGTARHRSQRGAGVLWKVRLEIG